MFLKFILFHKVKHLYNIINNEKVYSVNIIRLLFFASQQVSLCSTDVKIAKTSEGQQIF